MDVQKLDLILLILNQLVIYFKKIINLIRLIKYFKLNHFKNLISIKKKNTKIEKYKINFLYNYFIIVSLIEPLFSILIYYPIKIFLNINNFKRNSINKSKIFSAHLVSKIKNLDMSKYFDNSQIYIINEKNYTLTNNLLKFKPKTLLCYFPHNLLAYGYLFNGILSPNLDNNIKWMVSSFFSWSNLYPITNILKNKLNITSINNIKKDMINNNIIGLVPGGFYDASLTCYNEINCFISIGSIKYSIDYNYNYIPILTVGEELFYSSFLKLNKYFDKEQIKLLHKYNIPTIFPKTNINIKGNNKNLITLIGNPICCFNKTIIKVQELIADQLKILHLASQIYFNNKSKLIITFEKLNIVD